MILTDEEIVKILKITNKDKILDVGGSMKQHSEIGIDTIVDLIRPEESPYRPSRLIAKNFVRVNFSKGKLPFKNNEFDIALCTHTLEDLPEPFSIMDEMSRVARRGLIVTPSMGEDMVFGPLDFTNWLTGARRMPGQAHHKWFFVKKNNSLEIIPKIYPILYTSGFQIVGWKGEPEMVYEWNNKINYNEFIGIDMHAVIDRYKKFVNENRSKIEFGRVAFFIDNPMNMFRAFAKKIIKRGNGYIHRKIR